MGDFDELEGHDPKREDEAGQPTKKEPPVDKPAAPVSKKTDDSK